MAVHAVARYRTRLGKLKTERASWDDHWRDLSRNILPRRLRFDTANRNVGSKRHQDIVNNIATRALRVLASGMMAGITSPARNWFRLTVPDKRTAGLRAVRVWLDEVERRMFEVFARSNLYNALPLVYADLGCYGTTACVIEDDVEDVIRAAVWPIGSYALSQDDRFRVNNTYHETSFTVEQLARRFGEENVSSRVKNLIDMHHLDTWIDVVNVIEPNDDLSIGMADDSGKPWRSVWYETQSGDEETLLGTEGFVEFPVLVPRWSVVGEDVYGASPGMDALGDIRQLQFLEKRRSEGIDKMVRPPMRGPTSLRRRRKSIIAGAVTYVDGVGQRGTFEPSVIVDPRILQIEGELSRFESRIASSFYADLFLSMTSTNIPNMTAREVEERHEEKMLQLGPALERLHDELLDPLIDRTFGIMLRRGLIPPPPAQIAGTELRVEYLSILAQAQKLIGTVGVERLFTFGTQLSAFNPFVLDKLDFDKGLDQYGENLGTAADLLRSDEEVAELRKQRQQEQQAAASMQQAQQGASAVKDLAQAELGNDTALDRMLDQGGQQAAP